MDIIYTLIFALAAGILPALLWLWFWLHEDKRHPEPRRLIALAFGGGMLAVFIALTLERIMYTLITHTYVLILVWATIEEVVKYLVASFLVLNRKENDEPIDSVIYMITVALGFAALENTLFILTPLLENNFISTIATSNLRFMGSTLLHLIASSAIGVALAFAFKKSRTARSHALWIGTLAAITLHSLFNLFIIHTDSIGILVVFSVVWLAIIVLILLFEKIKRLDTTFIK